MTVLTVYATKDSTANASTGDITEFNTALLIVGSFTLGKGYSTYRALMQWDVSSIPSTADITSVVAGWYVDSKAGMTGEIYVARRNTSSWTEGSGAMPAMTSTGVSGGLPETVGAQTSSDAAFLAFVQGWVTGAFSNYGISLLVPSGLDDGDQILIRSREHTAGNTYDPSLTITYTTNTAPDPATPLTPDGGVTVPFDEPTACRWRFNDVNVGDFQSKADFRHRIVGAGVWTTVLTAVTLADTYLIPASTYADADDVEWQVLTYDAAGEPATSWSASAHFTAGTNPAPPTILSHNDDDVITSSTGTLVWSPAGDEYQVRIVADDGADAPDTGVVYFDTGRISVPDVTSESLTFPINNRIEHLQVRIWVSGLDSDWASVRVSVAYTPPAAPVVTVETYQVTGQDAALQVTVSNPA